MEIKPLRPELIKFLKKHNLVKKFEKQSKLFCQNPNYPSLSVKCLKPTINISLRFYLIN